jgi:hypothetical protein
MKGMLTNTRAGVIDDSGFCQRAQAVLVHRLNGFAAAEGLNRLREMLRVLGLLDLRPEFGGAAKDSPAALRPISLGPEVV